MSYTQARQAYLEWYGHLLTPPEVSPEHVRRSGNESLAALAVLEDRVDGLNYASEELTHATQTYLEAEDPAQRMAAVDSLLHQIEADLEVANLLWQVAEEAEEDAALNVVKRSVRGARIVGSLRRLAAEMPPSIEQTAESYELKRSVRMESRPTELAAAVDDLRFEIEDTLSLINDRANTVGLRLVRDVMTLGQKEWVAVMKAVDLLRGNEKVGDVGWGLEDEVKEAVTGIASVLRGTLVNIVEKILLVIQKNDLIRYTIADWLEQLKETEDNQGRKFQFSSLLEQLYQTQTFRELELDIWLQDAIEVAGIHTAADEIMHLGDNFDRLTTQAKRLSGLLSMGAIFANPVLMTIGFALQIGLLGTVVFAGYDHLDEGTRALNITRGIKEILIADIPISKQTRQKASNISTGHIRETRKAQVQKHLAKQLDRWVK